MIPVTAPTTRSREAGEEPSERDKRWREEFLKKNSQRRFGALGATPNWCIVTWNYHDLSLKMHDIHQFGVSFRPFRDTSSIPYCSGIRQQVIADAVLFRNGAFPNSVLEESSLDDFGGTTIYRRPQFPRNFAKTLSSWCGGIPLIPFIGR